MAVGQSKDRTPAKHNLLRQMVNRETFALDTTRMQWLGSHQQTLIDLTAGDGQDSLSGTSSPKILCEIARQHLFSPKCSIGNPGDPRRVKVHLFEKDPKTFTFLQLSTFDYKMPDGSLITYSLDSSTTDIPSIVQWDTKGPLFILNDPNVSRHSAFTPDLISALPQHTTTLSCLGFNANGDKRNWREEEWELRATEIVELIRRMPLYHDALIVKLTDSHQWVYFITGPGNEKWRSKTVSMVKSSFKSWDKGYELAWFRSQRSEFAKILKSLKKRK